MEKDKKSGRGYVAWNDDMDKILLDTFVEYYNKGDKSQNGWKPHVYTAAIKNISEKCRKEVTKDNILSRSKTFDKHHSIINGMLGTSGFGWDSNKNKISVDSDAVWEAYVEVSLLFLLILLLLSSYLTVDISAHILLLRTIVIVLPCLICCMICFFFQTAQYFSSQAPMITVISTMAIWFQMWYFQ